MVDLLLDPMWLIPNAAALGLVVGSFLNVVIYRLPREESLVRPGSHCPGCDAPVRPWDNVPVLSWLWLRGRCRSCGIRIALRYPAIELLTGGMFAAIAWRFGLALETPMWMVFSAGLIAAAAIDIDHQIIPDEISLGGLALGAVLVPTLKVASGTPLQDAAFFSAAGALLGSGLLWMVGFAHARVSVAMGRSFDHWPGEGEAVPRPSQLDYWIWFPGMGFGDVKLLAMIGVFLGPLGVMQTIMAASLVGLVMGLGWSLAARGIGAPFGFGPAIAVGALFSMFSPRLLFGLF